MPTLPPWANLLIQVLMYIFQLLTNKQAQVRAAAAIKAECESCKAK